MAHKRTDTLLHKCQSFIKNESGMTLPMIALSFVAMTGFVGTSIDVARIQLVQAKLSYALDAAGLAAGSTLNTTNLNTEVTKYLTANFPAGYMGASTPTATATLTNNNMVISLAGSTTVPTTFMQLFGIATVTVTATSQITRSASGLELVMVLDNTGSMNQSNKLTNLKSSATTLVNILYGGQTTVPNLWIGMVPFSQTVNIGTQHPTWMNTTYDNSLDWTKTAWAGCVEAREVGGLDITDDVPDTTKQNTLFKAYFAPTTGITNWVGNTSSSKYYQSNGATYTAGTLWSNPSSGTVYSNNWKSVAKSGAVTYTGPYNTVSHGPNVFCPQQVTQMTANQTTITNAISTLTAQGDTEIVDGLAWGWRMLSPKWQGLWGGEMNASGLPLAYGTAHMSKAVILLTDGYNTIDNTAHGAYGYLQEGRVGSTNSTTAVTDLDNKMISVCNSLKANGVYVYTISLGADPAPYIKGLLQSCATSPNYYFDSPNPTQLSTVFSAIGDSLSSLRVSR